VTELRRLLDGSDDEVERALLDAVRADRPRASALRDTALALGLATSTANALAATLPPTSALGTALGVEATSGVLPLGSSSGVVTSGAVTTSASGAVTALGSASLGVLGKSLLGGTLISFVALTTLDQTLGRSPNQPAPSQAASSARPASRLQTSTSHALPAAAVPTAAIAAASTATALEGSATASPHSAAEPRRAPARPATPAAVVQAAPINQAPARAAFAPLVEPQVASAAAASASLTAEIRLLDQARAALAAGNTATAGRLLDAYAANRPSSVLTQEAALLRVKLLLARGERSAAAQLARRIIATHPESAHVDSLRRLATER
jgi:TolA-binding protein